MRIVNFDQSLSIKVSQAQRRAIESITQKKMMTLGEASRLVLDAGFRAMGVRM